jgi:CRISPR-associated protein Cas2
MPAHADGPCSVPQPLSEIIHHGEDQVLFVDLGPAEGRGDSVITALGKAYSAIDAPCVVV